MGFKELTLTRGILGIFILYLFCNSLQVLSSVVNRGKGPALDVVPNHVELGRLSQDDKLSFSLEIINRGMEPLIIHTVSTDCGCVSTANKWKDMILQPRGKKDVKFTLIVGPTMRGLKRKAILFKTNDPLQEYFRVVVSFNVKPQYRSVALPAKLDFGRIDASKQALRKITLVSPYPEKLDVNSIKCSTPSILIHNLPSSGRRGAVLYTVEVQEDFPPGRISESIIFKTATGTIEVPITGYKTSILDCFPTKIVLPMSNSGRDTFFNITLSNTNGKAFRILEVRTSNDDFKLDVQTAEEPSMLHKLRLKISIDSRLKGAGRTKLFIITDRFGVKEVECFYYVY